MSTPPRVTFGDAIAETIDVLADGLRDHAAPYAAGAWLSTNRPGTADPLPCVQVAVDLDMVTYPIVSRATVRVTCWHERDDHAGDLAQLCQALLLTHTGDTLAAFTSLTGPMRGADPDTGTRYASLTVRASLRGTPL